MTTVSVALESPGFGDQSGGRCRIVIENVLRLQPKDVVVVVILTAGGHGSNPVCSRVPTPAPDVLNTTTTRL